ncbi:MAG: hypothetical protein M1538_00775 [Candidatus Marsarchaeota archaeon]|nr:hypothetical protein [Candidatus Marsarchaeota archaeon]
MVTLCERCKREIHEKETCNYCKRKLGYECIKASQKKSKIIRLVICKDCWTKMPLRSMYKNKLTPETMELKNLTANMQT